MTAGSNAEYENLSQHTQDLKEWQKRY